MKRVIAFVTNLINWITRLAVWVFGDAKDVWLTLLVILLVTGGSFLIFGMGEQGIRISGFLLELLGIGVVAKGLSESRELFGRPSLYQAVGKWLERYPKFRKDIHILVVGNISMQAQVGAASISSGSITTHTSNLEARISLLEEKLHLAEKRINDVRFRQEEESKNHREAISSEAAARSAGDADVRKQLEEAVVGGILLETMGIVWLAFGITLSSLSAELASLFSG